MSNNALALQAGHNVASVSIPVADTLRITFVEPYESATYTATGNTSGNGGCVVVAGQAVGYVDLQVLSLGTGSPKSFFGPFVIHAKVSGR